MSDILPKITVGEIQRPAALRQRAECLRQSAERCEDGASRTYLLDTVRDLEVKASLLEYEASQFR